MKHGILLLTLLSFFAVFSGWQLVSTTSAQQSSISVGIELPSGVVNLTDLYIAAPVNSLYELASVKAKVENREISLAFSTCAYRTSRSGICWPGWAGTLSIAGLARGSKQLTVNATDIFNNTGTRQSTFTYDLLPRLTIIDPIAETVARPNLWLTASCTDDDPAGCTTFQVTVNGEVVLRQSAKTNIDTDLSLTKYQGGSAVLCIMGIDSTNQSIEECRTFHVESSPMLSEVISVGGKIWDIQDNRILFSDVRNGSTVLKIHNRSNGTETDLVTLANKQLTYSSGFLTPKGAIFTASPTQNIYNNIYEWRDGQLFDLGTTASSTSLQVSGGFAIWTRSPMVLRDLVSATNTDINIPGTIVNEGNVLLPNGEIVLPSFSGGISHLYRYRNGQITQLSNKDIGQDLYPVSDGKNIVFRRLIGQNLDIVLLNESGETVLATVSGQHNPYPSSDYYQVNNGWIAYTKPNANGGLQVWLRAPSGQETQKSFFQADSYPNALSPNGDSAFTALINSMSKRYLPLPGQLPVSVSSTLGKAFWQDGKLLIIIGRSLFQYTPLANVSAASYSGTLLATEGISAVFGSRLANKTQAASTLPLPTNIAGTTVKVRDMAGVERLAPLFFVSPTQVNYQIPPGTSSGQALVTITSADGTVSTGLAPIAAVAPSLFTANADGQGVPAATLLRVKANGEQIYEPVAVFDSVQNKFIPRPIELGSASDQVFLILFGTGLRYRSGLSGVTATIRGESVPVLYVGPQKDFVGLDQVNIGLPRSLVNRGDVDLLLTVDQQASNAVRIRIE